MKLSKLYIFVLILSGSITTVYAQDSIKRAGAAKPPAVKPTVTPITPVKPKYNLYKKATTPATQTPAGGTVQVPLSTSVQPPAAPPSSLYGQYAYLQSKVYNYQRPLVAALYKNYMDTLSTTRRKLKEAQVTLAAQTKTIDTLKSTVNSKEQILNNSQQKADEISLVGIPLSKSTYNLVMWGLVIGFGAIAGIVITRSGSYSREAHYRIKLYNELEEEHKAYKAKANEKEKKLARELQTERNKVDELMGKG
ncbi:hypothetical protein FFF34_017605 [Inquilinus sp. KBS0705]|nr:hypothetical protein FFF34_017605 [Inquilinus sp. KBS0705]